MIDQDKEALYLALKSIDRMGRSLAGRVPDDVLDFLDKAWGVLKGSAKRVGLSRIDRRIGRLIVDEQDAGYERALENKFYYALSNFILYLKEGHSAAAEGVLEEALEFFLYQATDDYLAALGVDSIVHSDELEEQIASDVRVITERERQSADRVFARSVVSWESVDRNGG